MGISGAFLSVWSRRVLPHAECNHHTLFRRSLLVTENCFVTEPLSKPKFSVVERKRAHRPLLTSDAVSMSSMYTIRLQDTLVILFFKTGIVGCDRRTPNTVFRVFRSVKAETGTQMVLFSNCIFNLKIKKTKYTGKVWQLSLNGVNILTERAPASA